MQIDMHDLENYSPVSMQGGYRQPMDDPALYNRPDMSTLLRLHDYQAMPEVFCNVYRQMRRPPTHSIVQNLPGQVRCSNLGITVRTGRSGRWRTRKAKPTLAEELLTELAASGAAQEVQQHAAATDWPDIADLIQQDLTNANDMMIHHKPNAPIQADANNTAAMSAECSAKRPHCLPASAAAAITKQHSHDRKAHDTRDQTCYTHLQQHGGGMSGMQLPASTTYSAAAAHPDTAMANNMADDFHRKPHLSKAKRKRNTAVSLEQYKIEEDHRGIQPETPEQEDQARGHSTFRRRDNSSREGIGCARPKMGDIVWAKILNHPFWPAQVTEPAARHKVRLWKQYGSLTESGIHVKFFGDDDTVGYARPADVKPFCWEDEDGSRPGKTKPGKTKCAVREAKAAQLAQVQLAQKNKRQRQQ